MESRVKIRPAYAESFRCIGAACEETCCQQWTVPVDRATWERYQQLPDVPLGALIRSSVVPQEPEVSRGDPRLFARIQLNSNRMCPLLSTEGLCGIQTAFGDSSLPHVCRTFPRVIHQEQGAAEAALTFSCPEAARHVLLDPDLLASGMSAVVSGVELEQCAGAELSEETDERQPLRWFWPLRSIVLGLVGNRTYPLWQRLFLLNLLCHRLDQFRGGALKRNVSEFLSAFELTVQQGSLRRAMEALPIDTGAQLDLVLQLAGVMLHLSGVLPSFAKMVASFTGGIGNAPGATIRSLTANYDAACRLYFEPFFEGQPHILENYLANTILRCRFPFGAHDAHPGEPPSMVREFDKLMAQFALTRGLLIGVSGDRRESFSAADVVRTCSVAARHFEHHPAFLDRALALMVECRMTGAAGCSILARNSRTSPLDNPQSPPLAQPIPQTQQGPA